MQMFYNSTTMVNCSENPRGNNALSRYPDLLYASLKST